MSSNSVTIVTYNREDIERLISYLPTHQVVFTLDKSYFASRNFQRHLPLTVKPRHIVELLTNYFLRNPIVSGKELDDMRLNSDIPYFLYDLKRFPADPSVVRLMKIPNIEKLTDI